MPSEYIPQRGDIILLDEEQRERSIQSARIPAIVISPKEYNGKTGMAVFCLISERIENYPFEVKIPKNLKISGVILSDRIRTLNWKTRKIELICKLPEKLLEEVLNKIRVLL